MELKEFEWRCMSEFYAKKPFVKYNIEFADKTTDVMYLSQAEEYTEESMPNIDLNELLSTEILTKPYFGYSFF